MSDEWQNDLNILMNEDPLNLSTDPATEGGRKLDAIIAYQRKVRGLREQGVKTKKPKPEGAAPKLDLATLMAKPAKESSSFKRRV